MNKSDLIARMTERLGGDRTAAAAAVNGVLEEIEGGVARGERVSLTGFGTFERRERAARTGRNPRTGAAIQVGASVVPVFRAGTGFRTLLTGGTGANGSRRPVATETPASVTSDRDTQKAGKKARNAAGRSAESKSKAGKDKGKDKKDKRGKKAAKDPR